MGTVVFGRARPSCGLEDLGATVNTLVTSIPLLGTGTLLEIRAEPIPLREVLRKPVLAFTSFPLSSSLPLGTPGSLRPSLR